MSTSADSAGPVDVGVSRPDMDAVCRMLDRAIEYGLAVEVVTAFGNYRASGDEAEEATVAALYDWDL